MAAASPMVVFGLDTEDGMNQVWGPLWRDFRLQYLPLA